MNSDCVQTFVYALIQCKTICPHDGHLKNGLKNRSFEKCLILLAASLQDGAQWRMIVVTIAIFRWPALQINTWHCKCKHKIVSFRLAHRLFNVRLDAQLPAVRLIIEGVINASHWSATVLHNLIDPDLYASHALQAVFPHVPNNINFFGQRVASAWLRWVVSIEN